jgi:hypothetical protein
MNAEVGLDDILDPLIRCLDADSARKVVEFQFDDQLQERIDQLGAAANEGTLDDQERSEYEAMVNAADFVAILKLKARRQLQPNAA